MRSARLHLPHRSNRRERLLVALPALGLVVVSACSSPGAEPDSVRDEAALQGLEVQQAEAWARGNGDAYAATFTEDADFVDVTGGHIRGRAEIARSLQEGFDTSMAGTRISPARERTINNRITQDGPR